MSYPKTHVLKFGGSSLKNPSLIQQSVNTVINKATMYKPVVIVSAVGGVTDALIKIADHYHEDRSHMYQSLNKVEQRHRQLFDNLVSISHPNHGNLQDLFIELRSTLNNNGLRNTHFRAWKDRVLSVGERASAVIFAAALSEKGYPAQAYNSQHFIKTDSTFGQANVDHDLSQQLIRKHIQTKDNIPVITGFIGSNSDRQVTTLGRSGSDYTAGLVSNALGADRLEIWTDVNGVLSADPKWVNHTESIKQLSFGDISELSAHGAKVIHPKTIQPIQKQDTTVLVKNSYNPEHPGTRITSNYHSNGALKTITITGPYVQLQIDPEYAFPLLDHLRRWNNNPDGGPIAFSQQSHFEAARFLIKQSLFEQISDQLAEWARDQNTFFDLDDNLYKVKKFSNRFTKDEQLSGRILSLFADEDLCPLHTNRNHDERFISFLFQKDDAQKAANILNNLELSHQNKSTVNLFVAGTGAVGHTLIDLLPRIHPDNFDLKLLGVCNSRKTLWNKAGIEPETPLNWDQANHTNWTVLINRLTKHGGQNLIFIDATGSKEVAKLYPKLFANGIHVITPSKLANTFEQSFFDHLQELTKGKTPSFQYETTVGAGLPVLSSIKGLQASGDRITEISGVVSGTMTYLFNQLEQGVSFSKAISDARQKGYAEPDPRDDLSGEDVARKFLTLARTLGITIEREELEVKSLIPSELNTVSRDAFLDKLSDHDSTWKQRVQAAKKRGEVLRYTGTLHEGKVSIGIQSVSKNSPLGQLKGTDNIIQIYSEFYNDTPLVIQGPGAGKDVTAAGILSDLLKTAKTITY